MNITIENEILLINQNDATRVKEVIDNVFVDIGELAVYVSRDNDVRSYMVDEEISAEDNMRQSSILDKLNMYRFVYDYIDSIYLYSDIREESLTNDSAIETEWYNEHILLKGQGSWAESRKKNSKYPYVISYVNPAYKGYGIDWIGAVVINVNIEKLANVIKKNNVDNVDNEEDVIITDGSGKIMFSYDRDLFDQNIDDIELYKDIGSVKNELSCITKMNGSRYVISITKSDDHMWYYMSTQELKYYKKEQQSLVHSIIMMIFICSVGALVLSFVITLKSMNPVIKLLTMLDHPDSWGDEVANEKKRDEVKLIGEKIITVIMSNAQLRSNMEIRLNKLNRAQMVALQAQINPHFLYNTLETLRWLIIDPSKDSKEASDMISNLSKLLRISLESGEELITLEEEIKYTKYYLDIMSVRYEDKLIVEWDVDERVLLMQVVKLTLQPLIENAIYHGVKKKKRMSCVTITASIDEAFVRLRVIDDGVGMSNELMLQMNDKFSNSNQIPTEHIGLSNVNQKIKLVYGEGYGIQLLPNKPTGLIAEVKLPKQLM